MLTTRDKQLNYYLTQFKNAKRSVIFRLFIVHLFQFLRLYLHCLSSLEAVVCGSVDCISATNWSRKLVTLLEEYKSSQNVEMHVQE